jgi:hypothetical protein
MFLEELPWVLPISNTWMNYFVLILVKKILKKLIFTENETWSTPKTSGVVPSARAAHTAVAFKDSIYFFGGRDEHIFFNDLFSFSTITMTWTKLCSINNSPPSRAGHTMNLIDSKTLLVWGGSDGQNFKSTILLYQIEESMWSEGYMSGDVPEGRYWHTAELVEDKIYSNSFKIFKFQFLVEPIQQVYLMICILWMFDLCMQKRLKISKWKAYLPCQIFTSNPPQGRRPMGKLNQILILRRKFQNLLIESNSTNIHFYKK